MNCPKCTSVLREMRLEEVDFDYCLSCKGIWFDKDEMAAMAEMAADLPKVDPHATKTNFVCPRCGKGLEEMKFMAGAELRIDRCPGCHGIWLDKGEMKAVEKIAARLEDPASRMMRLCKELEAKGYQILASSAAGKKGQRS